MLGPSKNLYQFTQLRDMYKNKFIQASQNNADLDSRLKGLQIAQAGPPPLTGAYASLISNNLEDTEYGKLKTRMGTDSDDRNEQSLPGFSSQSVPMVSYQLLSPNNFTAAHSRSFLQQFESINTPPNEFANDPQLGMMNSWEHSQSFRKQNSKSQLGSPQKSIESGHLRRNHTEKASKRDKNRYEGMTREQVVKTKREMKERKLWEKHKQKLIRERQALQKKFFNSYMWNCFAIERQKPSVGDVREDQRIQAMYLNRGNINQSNVNKSATQNYVYKDNAPIEKRFNLQNVVDDSCSFFEQMEKKKEGSLEQMLVGIREKVEKGKVKIEKREQYDPQR